MSINLKQKTDGTASLVDGYAKEVATFGAGGSTAAGTGVTVATVGAGAFNRETFTFVNTPVTLADAAGAIAYGGLNFADLPAGAIVVMGATANLAVTKSAAGVNADWDGDFSIGTVTASNNASLATTEANIIASTATPQAAAGATTAKGRSTAAVYLDGTSTAVELFLNFLVDDADHDVTTTATNLILNGTVTVLWANLGDY
jgi:sucrose-6-phosphate hydrolase SacC (GH32 family)